MTISDKSSNQTRQFCTFRSAQRLFGVEVTDVKEIHPVVKFTPVFHASEAVRGIVNIRGQVHLVIDLRVLLGFESRETDDLSQIILFKPHVGESFGILVDDIGDVAKTDENQIEETGKDGTVRDKSFRRFTDLIEGVCKLKTELLVVLNSGALLKKMVDDHKR